MKVRLLAITAGCILAAGAAWAGPTPGGVDTDGDTVQDAFDNCRLTPNSTQTDTNHFGCGDACSKPNDCSFDGLPAVGAPDFAILGMNFGKTVPKGTAGDCAGGPGNGPDGVVGAPDFAKLGMEFGNTAGPSGITNAQCNPARCQCTPQ